LKYKGKTVRALKSKAPEEKTRGGAKPHGKPAKDEIRKVETSNLKLKVKESGGVCGGSLRWRNYLCLKGNSRTEGCKGGGGLGKSRSHWHTRVADADKGEGVGGKEGDRELHLLFLAEEEDGSFATWSGAGR